MNRCVAFFQFLKPIDTKANSIVGTVANNLSLEAYEQVKQTTLFKPGI